jgi:hypothetical protein
MRLALLLTLYYLAMTGTTSIFIRSINRSENFVVDPDTRKLCKWYSELDHEGEIAPSRWK